MKPERLELEGFTAFRAPAVLDFGDLELFAVTGPTGAGKSSLIDGITFALYGQVPRHGAGSVEPVISLGAARARVRFDFSLGDDRYTVVRFVARTSSGGATTSEARLECGDEVLASGAREVTRAVEGLLGLEVEHFTRSVMLPQGEFAAFLHDSPSGQQELLTALLDFGILDEVKALARERTRKAEGVVEANRVRLDDLSDATTEAEQRATARVARLGELADRVSELESALADATKQKEEHEATLVKLDRDRSALRGTAIPEGVSSLASALGDAREATAAAAGRREEAASAVEQARARLDRFPSLDVLDSYDERRRALDEARRQLSAIDVESARRRRTQAEQARSSATTEHRAAVERLDLVKARHAAHTLAEGLSEGDPCPVCGRPLDTDPSPDGPGDLDRARGDVANAEARLAEAQNELEQAQHTAVQCEARAQSIREAIERAVEGLTEVPDADETERMRRERTEAAEAARLATDEQRRVDAELARANDQLTDLQADERRMRERFDRVRTEVAHLDPPPARHLDLVEDWHRLRRWSEERQEAVEAERADATGALEDAVSVIEARRGELDSVVGEAGVELEPGATAVTAVVEARATARAALETVRARLAEREGLEADTAVFEEQMQVAKHLSRHLRADGFEAWLLEEAIDTLLDGANELLGELSGDAYSLGASGRVIEVVDHRNADERRSVKSLSGGETFLVSLALALSLGRRLVEMSERGGAALEAIFLDEGFGTLDAETLDTVAAVVTELASRGRMVGLVTHVKDLADQIPVRFHVDTSPTGSTVTRGDTVA